MKIKQSTRQSKGLPRGLLSNKRRNLKTISRTRICLPSRTRRKPPPRPGTPTMPHRKSGRTRYAPVRRNASREKLTHSVLSASRLCGTAREWTTTITVANRTNSPRNRRNSLAVMRGPSCLSCFPYWEQTARDNISKSTSPGKRLRTPRTWTN